MKWLALTALLAGCAPSGPAEDRRGILVIGDSVMAWNGADSIENRLEAELGREVTKRARSGASISQPNPVLKATGFDISERAVPGRWDWVVMDGGANDLKGECGCDGCEAVLDTLIAPGARAGEIPALVGQLLSGGARRVLIMGYYGPSGLGGSFDACEEELEELDARASGLASRDRRVFFVDAGQVVSSDTPEFYGPDNVHPSPAGSAAIAALLARTMRGIEG